MENKIIYMGDEIYQSLINEFFSNYQKIKIIDTIDNIFSENLNLDYSSHRYIEKLVEELYFDEVDTYKKKMFNHLLDNLEEHTKILFKKFESDPNNIEQYLSYYNDGLNIKYRSDSLEEINYQFNSDFSRMFISKFDDMPNNMEEKIRYDIMHEVNRYLNKICEEMIDELNNQISKTSDKLMEESKIKLEENKHDKELEESNKNEEEHNTKINFSKFRFTEKEEIKDESYYLSRIEELEKENMLLKSKNESLEKYISMNQTNSLIR